MVRKLGQAAVLDAKDWAKLDREFNPTYQLIFALSRLTTARIGEILQLRVGDVYADPARRIPNDEIQYRREIRKGKDFNHTVPVSSSLKRYLKAYDPSANPNDFLFPGRYGGHLSYEAVLKYLRRVAEKVGLGDLRITTHSGRRSGITALANRGTSLKAMQRITGHRQVTNLLRYVEATPNQVKEALEGIF